MKRVKENENFLKVLCFCSKKLLRNLINGANREHILTLCECILNCLNGNIELNESDKSHLKRYKKTLRTLIRKKTGLKKRKELLIQKGSGFLPIIIPAVLSVVTEILSRS